MATTVPTTMQEQQRKKSASGKAKGAAKGRTHYFGEMDKELSGFLKKIGKQRKLDDRQMTLPGFEEMI